MSQHRDIQFIKNLFPIVDNIQYDAAKSGKLDVLKYIVDKYEATHPGDLFPIDDNIQYLAVEWGNLDVLRYLIDEKGEPIYYKLIFDGLDRARSSDPNHKTKIVKYLRIKYLSEEKGIRNI